MVLAAGLLALLTLAVCGIRLLPRGGYDLDDVRAGLVTASADCPTPCWAGIQTGVTTWQEALAILEAHPWIGVVDSQLRPAHIDEPGYERGIIIWLWSGTQPAWLATDQGSRLDIMGGLVSDITLFTRLPLADVWLALGPPEYAALLPQNFVVTTAAQGPVRSFQGSYTTPRLDVTADWPCPMGLHARWWQPVTIHFNLLPVYDAPGSAWAVRPVCD